MCVLLACASFQDLESGFSRFHDYICGVIPFSQQAVFERMLFRLTRGNSLVKYALCFVIAVIVCLLAGASELDRVGLHL